MHATKPVRLFNMMCDLVVTVTCFKILIPGAKVAVSAYEHWQHARNSTLYCF